MISKCFHYTYVFIKEFMSWRERQNLLLQNNLKSLFYLLREWSKHCGLKWDLSRVVKESKWIHFLFLRTNYQECGSLKKKKQVYYLMSISHWVGMIVWILRSCPQRFWFSLQLRSLLNIIIHERIHFLMIWPNSVFSYWLLHMARDHVWAPRITMMSLSYSLLI